MGGSVGISKVTQRVTSLVDKGVRVVAGLGVSVFLSSSVTVLTEGVVTSSVVMETVVSGGKV